MAAFRSAVASTSLGRQGIARSNQISAGLLAPLNRSLQTHALSDHNFDPSTIPESSTEEFSIPLKEDSFHSHRCDGPEPSVSVTKDELVWMYKNMVQMRRMEQAADALYKQKLIRGFCHLAIGQEAVAVGMESAMKPDDKVITAYRCHPFAVMRGGTIKGVIAELLGRVDGMSHGKGGSMHIFTKSFFGGNGIVGAQVPLGAGIAFAQKYLKEDDKHATFAMYGDGASNQGQVFEAFNMAALWKLPCVFICENNKYGMGTSAARSSSNTKYYTRGDVIPGLQINAMDILAVRKGIQYAKEWTTSGKGPMILEMVTYRYGGHSMSDPGKSSDYADQRLHYVMRAHDGHKGTTYRTREEIQNMRSNNDPITGLKTRIVDWKVLSESELKAIDKEAREQVDKAVEEAKASPEPSPEKDLWTDIYFKGTAPEWLRGREREEVHTYSEDERKGADSSLLQTQHGLGQQISP